MKHDQYELGSPSHPLWTTCRILGTIAFCSPVNWDVPYQILQLKAMKYCLGNKYNARTQIYLPVNQSLVWEDKQTLLKGAKKSSKWDLEGQGASQGHQGSGQDVWVHIGKKLGFAKKNPDALVAGRKVGSGRPCLIKKDHPEGKEEEAAQFPRHNCQAAEEVSAWVGQHKHETHPECVPQVFCTDWSCFILATV